MYKRILIIFIALISTLNLLAQQDYSNKFDIKIGAGFSFDWDAIPALCFENELNYKINNYFAVAASFGIGRSVFVPKRNSLIQNTFLSGSANAFVSPFKNNRRNNFKIGLGYTCINETMMYKTLGYIPAYDGDVRYSIGKYTSHCFNVILEDEYKITTRLMIGGKLFYTGEFTTGGLIYGGIIKFGVVL